MNQGFRGWSTLDEMAPTDASALQALKQQARADGERRGKAWALECLAGKLPLLSMEKEDRQQSEHSAAFSNSRMEECLCHLYPGQEIDI